MVQCRQKSLSGLSSLQKYCTKSFVLGSGFSYKTLRSAFSYNLGCKVENNFLTKEYLRLARAAWVCLFLLKILHNAIKQKSYYQGLSTAQFRNSIQTQNKKQKKYLIFALHIVSFFFPCAPICLPLLRPLKSHFPSKFQTSYTLIGQKASTCL